MESFAEAAQDGLRGFHRNCHAAELRRTLADASAQRHRTRILPPTVALHPDQV